MTKGQADTPLNPFRKCNCEVYDSLHREIRRLKELYHTTNEAKKYERSRARNLARKLSNMSRGHESMRKERNRMKKNLEVVKEALERIAAGERTEIALDALDAVKF